MNRATLERQLLLRRAKMSAHDAVAHLAGLQAQAPFPPYYALWSRLHGFQPSELASLLEERQVVRIALMRGTVHLVTAADALAWRPVLQVLYDRDLKTNTQHARELAGLDHSEVASAARELLTASALTSTALGAELAKRWNVPAASLTHLARGRLPLVQTPPRAIWGKAGQTTYACLDEWVGAPLPRLRPLRSSSATCARSARRRWRTCRRGRASRGWAKWLRRWTSGATATRTAESCWTCRS